MPTNLSAAATQIAEYLVILSKNGTKLDPQVVFADVAEAIPLSMDEVEYGVLELEDHGLVELSREISSAVARRRFWPTFSLFAEFDSKVLGFDTEADAAAIARLLVEESKNIVATKILSDRLQWPTRRLNSALNYLEHKGVIEAIHSIGEAPWTMGHVRVTAWTRKFVRDHPQTVHHIDLGFIDDVADSRRLFEQYEHGRLGAQFEPVDDRLAISASGQVTDREAASEQITWQLHEQVKLKANELASSTNRLGNHPGWQSLARSSQRFSALVHADTQHVADRIGEVWSELVSLGSFLEQDDSLKQSDDTIASPLDPDQRRPLVDLLQTAGPWIRRFPTARLIDDEHASFQAPLDQIEPAREVLAEAVSQEFILEADADVLDAALSNGKHLGHQSKKARTFGIFSTRNLAFRAATLVATGLTLGVFQHVGKEAAKDLVLAQKAARLIVSAEEPLLRFLSSLPADVRTAVRDLIDRLKAQHEGAGFPLPQPPQMQTPIKHRRKDDR